MSHCAERICSKCFWNLHGFLRKGNQSEILLNPAFNEKEIQEEGLWIDNSFTVRGETNLPMAIGLCRNTEIFIVLVLTQTCWLVTHECWAPLEIFLWARSHLVQSSQMDDESGCKGLGGRCHRAGDFAQCISSASLWHFWRVEEERKMSCILSTDRTNHSTRCRDCSYLDPFYHLPLHRKIWAGRAEILFVWEPWLEKSSTCLD